MRWLTLCFLGLISCKSQHQIDPSTKAKTLINTPVLQDGTTRVELIPNTQLLMKSDEFSTNYLALIPGNKVVFKFHYQRDQLENTADGHYEEFLFFEVDDLREALSLQNDQLKTVQMTFGRLCYCKGTSGYFPVHQGELSLRPHGERLFVKLKFQVDEIPQLIDEIDLVMKWK